MEVPASDAAYTLAATFRQASELLLDTGRVTPTPPRTPPAAPRTDRYHHIHIAGYQGGDAQAPTRVQARPSGSGRAAADTRQAYPSLDTNPRLHRSRPGHASAAPDACEFDADEYAFPALTADGAHGLDGKAIHRSTERASTAAAAAATGVRAGFRTPASDQPGQAASAAAEMVLCIGAGGETEANELLISTLRWLPTAGLAMARQVSFHHSRLHANPHAACRVPCALPVGRAR